MRSIMREADTLAAQGVREIVLISQDSMAYGCDLAGKPGLSSLLTSLASIEKIEWIRFLYCNPEAVSGDLLKVMAGEQKICPYLDIPLQHVSAPVLKAMRRPGSYGSFMKLIERVRKIIPGITLRSTFIVGFPGEGSEDYMQLLAFLEEARLDRVGIFAWSREEGTAAWGIKPRVPTRVAKARLKEAMLLQQRISLEKNRGLIGSVLEVIADGPLEGKPDMRGLVQEAGGVIRRAKLAVSGRSRADAPEVDGKVFFSGEARAGEIVPVRISGVTPYDCFGELMLKG
jgi:ribosomal protein S12 methylthiotransferase